MKFKMLNISLLKPHEEIKLDRAKQLYAEIKQTNIWTTPILVDSEFLIVMDGHHRLKVAQLLELNSLPCFVLPYSSIDVYKCGTNIPFSSELIIEKALNNELFPYKTTRHIVRHPLPNISIALDALKIFESF